MTSYPRRKWPYVLGLATSATIALTAYAGAPSVITPGSGASRVLAPAPVVLRYQPSAQTGVRIAEDANVISHVLFTGASNGITDKNAKGTTLNTWTANGTVPESSAVPWTNGAAHTAGPFSDSNYYSLAASSTLSPATFTVCMSVHGISSYADAPVAISDGANAVNGWYLEFATTGQWVGAVNKAGTNVQASAGTCPLFGVCVGCLSYDGTTAIATLNGGPAGTGTLSGFVPNTAGTLYIGRYSSTGLSLAGNVDEVYYTSQVYTAAQQQAWEKAYLGQVGTAGEQPAVTRNSTATDIVPPGTSCNAPPCLFFWPNAIGRIDSNGLLIEKASTNLIQQSADLHAAAWTLTNTTATDNVTDIANRANQATTLTSTVNGGKAESSTTVAVAGPYTISLWAKASPTQSFDLRLRDTTGASDVKACNALSATAAWTYFTCANSANPSAGDSIAVDIYPGTSASTGTIIASDVQLEQSTYASSYIETAAAAVTRNADSFLPLIVNGGGNMPRGSFSLSFLSEWATPVANQAIVALGDGSNGKASIDTDATHWVAHFCDTAATCNTASKSIAANPNTASETIAASWDLSTNVTVTVNGSTATTAITGTGPWTPSTFFLGESAAATNGIGGWISNFCEAQTSFGCP